MSSNSLQTFAGGLFLATAVLGGTFYFTQGTEDDEPTSRPLTIEQMVNEMEEHGLVVLSEKELKQLKEEQNLAPEKEQVENEEEPQQTVYILFLDISPGMTSFDIADRLIRGKIINDRDQFLHDVKQLGLSTSLKTGFYELSSEMTIEEIIQKIS